MTDNERYLLMKRRKEEQRKWQEESQKIDCEEDCEEALCEEPLISAPRNKSTKKQYEPIRGGGFEVGLDNHPPCGKSNKLHRFNNSVQTYTPGTPGKYVVKDIITGESMCPGV